MTVAPHVSLALALVVGVVGCGPAAFEDVGPPVAGGVVRVDGAELPYEVYGTGPDTVVFASGGPAFPGAVLQAVARRAGRRHVAILYDARGRGASRHADPDSTTPGVARDVADLEAVTAHFGLGRFALVAHHYGALVAASYALRHPDRVTRLALIGPMMPRSGYNYDLALNRGDSLARREVALQYASDLAHRPREFCEATWGWMLAPAQELDPTVLRRLGPLVCGAPDSVLERRGQFKQAVLTALAAWDYRDSIAAIRVPLLVLQGDRNAVLNHSAANWAYRTPGGLLLLVSGSPFFPWITDPVRTAYALDAFLDGRTPDGARRPDLKEVISPDDSLRHQSATSSHPAP